MTTTTNDKITINNIMEEPIFQEFVQIRNLTLGSSKVYATALKQWVLCHNKTLHELIQEADNEEEQRIRMSKRKIKQRLIKYKQYLQEHHYQNNTINGYITNIRAFYYTFDIYSPELPKNKQKRKSYKDMLTADHIIKAFETTRSNKMKAIILFMASSGNAVQETANLTIQDFIDATSEYHHETRIEYVIKALQQRSDVIPCFTIQRQKTDVPYYTFCTPEATHYILNYLQERLITKGINSNEKLFGVKKDAIITSFRRLNDVCGFGWVNKTHRFFTSHALRRFFATSLHSAGVSELTIDFFEGRTVSETHSAYFNPSPVQLKKRYIAAMNAVTLLGEVTYNDITSEEKLELNRYREKENILDEKMKQLEIALEEYVRLSSS